MGEQNKREIDFSSLAPYVRYVQEVVSDYTFLKVPPRIIYDYELVYVASGKCIFHINGKPVEIGAGELLLIKPFVQHSLYLPANQNSHYYAVHFDLVYMGETFDFSAEEVYVNVDYQNIDQVPEDARFIDRPLVELKAIAFPDTHRCSEPHRMERLFRELYHVFHRNEFGRQLETRILLLKIIMLLMRELTTAEGISKSHKYAHVMAEVTQFLKLHYAEKIDYNKLALSYNFAPNYFRNLFREATGKSLIEYVTQYRMEKAKTMLLETNETIHRIASMVGYENPYYFSRIFRKLEGMSPKQYAETISARRMK